MNLIVLLRIYAIGCAIVGTIGFMVCITGLNKTNNAAKRFALALTATMLWPLVALYVIVQGCRFYARGLQLLWLNRNTHVTSGAVAVVVSPADSQDVLIPDGAPIPVRRSKVYKTAKDKQKCVGIHVVQGTAKHAEDNKTLVEFDVTGETLNLVEVTLDVNADGALRVIAVDKTTGLEYVVDAGKIALRPRRIWEHLYD